MTPNDKAYYQHRAEVEIELAQQATEPPVVQAHYKLAEAYLARVSELDRVEEQA